MFYFFDVDGVLSAPMYWDAAGEPVIGFSDQDWIDFCKKEGEDAYKKCLPVPKVKEYAKGLCENGDKLFVLSTSSTPYEAKAKTRYLDTNYPGMFISYFYTDHDVEKIEKIKEVAETEGIGIDECALVEDTFSTLLLAHEEGIKAIHISNILADNISR